MMNLTADPPTLPEVLMEFGESMKPVCEFIMGQKKEWEERGFSSHVAEKMCADLFSQILWMMRGGGGGGGGI